MILSKRTLPLFFGGLLFLSGCWSAQHLFQGSIEEPKESGLKPVEFTPARPQSWKTENGIEVLVLEDNELPIVRGALFTRGGSYWEPQNIVGLAGFTGSLLREGGAGDHSAREVDKILETLSAQIEASIGGEYGTIGFKCLKENLNEVFSIFEDIVLAPRFEQDRLNLHKVQSLEGLRRRKDDPEVIAGLTLSKYLFGSAPYGAIQNKEDIQRISREAIQKEYERLIQPEGAIFIVAGPVNEVAVRKLIDNRLTKWNGADEKKLVPPPLTTSTKVGAYFVSGPFQQSTLVIAQRGPVRHTEDQYAIQLFNGVFGGGMSSRLFQRVRGQYGLAYDIQGAISPGFGVGRNTLVFQTKSSSVGQALVESLKVLEEMQTQPISETELESRKRLLLNSFVFANAEPDSILRREASLRLLGYPLDYDERYRSNIEKVSSENIVNVASRYWDLNQSILVVVGDDEAYRSLEAVLPLLPASFRDGGVRKVSFEEVVR